jgi:hypothetical protein
VSNANFHLALPSYEADDFDFLDQLSQANRDDWVLLRLVACVAVATLLIGVAVSLL